ncbi:hypothetical protein A2U01_0097836, partial [Trifolium medium]|nr:hypothetical protein [Trifolium medium]
SETARYSISGLPSLGRVRIGGFTKNSSSFVKESSIPESTRNDHPFLKWKRNGMPSRPSMRGTWPVRLLVP